MAYRRKRPKTALFIVSILILLTAAMWFALSPYTEKQSLLDRQSELLRSIEWGDGVIAIDDSIAAEPLNFYIGGEYNPDASETVTEDAPRVTVFYETNFAETATDGNEIITGIGILTIRRIDARLPVTDGVSKAQLKVAVGHVPQSAPIGGTGNAIIAGHRSYTYGQYFNRLGELEPGDIITYQPKGGGEMIFEVYEILEVLPDDPATYADFPGERILTLHTCTPVRVATHRLLVRAKLISMGGQS